MSRISRPLIFAVVIFVLLWLVWSRLRILVVIPLSLGQALFLFGALALGGFLVLDHLLNRNR